MKIALAGRRIDVLQAESPRFPLANAPIVRERLRTLFAARKADTLVCSAACGADLLALSAAKDLGLECRIILPFARDRFRETSVTDRPGDWGSLFDELCQEAEATGNLIILDSAGEDNEAYLAANKRILDEVVLLAQRNIAEHRPEGTPPDLSEGDALVVIVWEGRSRGDDDATAAFANLGRAYGLSVFEVLTQ